MVSTICFGCVSSTEFTSTLWLVLGSCLKTTIKQYKRLYLTGRLVSENNDVKDSAIYATAERSLLGNGNEILYPDRIMFLTAIIPIKYQLVY